MYLRTRFSCTSTRTIISSLLRSEHDAPRTTLLCQYNSVPLEALHSIVVAPRIRNRIKFLIRGNQNRKGVPLNRTDARKQKTVIASNITNIAARR